MYGRRVIFVISLICSLSIASARSSNAQQKNRYSQNSTAIVDRQKSDEARTPLRGGSFGYLLSRVIIHNWEQTVDAAGLHTLLNQNQKAYTLFNPDFKKLEFKQVFKLFAIENQADLQRVLKCHVVTQKVFLKDLPNDEIVTFKTMEPGCTITLQAKRSQRPELKKVVKPNIVSGRCNLISCEPDRRLEDITYVPTGKMSNETQLIINGDSSNRKLSTEATEKGFGNYLVYDASNLGVMMPPDLKSKYLLPAEGRPLTD